MSHRLRIVISGLTAAGKTTHGLRLANDLELPFHSASDAFRRFLGVGNGIRGDRWSPQVDRERMKRTDLDDLVDEYMIDTLERESGIFDAALLPWLTDREDCLFVWLDSGVLNRTRKCYVSHLEGLRLDLSEAGRVVMEKDQFSITRVLNRHGKAMYADRDRFHVVISNDDTLERPTDEAAEEGIQSFHPIIRDSVSYALGICDERPDSPWIIHIRRLCGARKNEHSV